VGKSTFLRILAGQVELSAGSMRLGETVRLGYYEQTGLNITAQQESSTILRFVQEAVEKGGGDRGEDGGKESSPQIVVETGGAVGRRKTLAGKEPGVSVQVAAVGGGGATVAYSEREAMALLKRFQFPARRWQDRVGQLSGGERRRLQLLQVLTRAPNVLLLDEPSNDLGRLQYQSCVWVRV
jgi:ATP-binding cassette subfamily F protein uup